MKDCELPRAPLSGRRNEVHKSMTAAATGLQSRWKGAVQKIRVREVPAFVTCLVRFVVEGKTGTKQKNRTKEQVLSRCLVPWKLSKLQKRWNTSIHNRDGLFYVHIPITECAYLQQMPFNIIFSTVWCVSPMLFILITKIMPWLTFKTEGKRYPFPARSGSVLRARVSKYM